MSKVKRLINCIAVFICFQTFISTFASNADTTYYVYISLKGDNKVSLYKMNKQDGSLQKVYDQAVAGGPASIALHPSKNYMYVAQRNAKTISAFSIDKTTGKLTLLNTINAIDNPVYVSTDKAGNYLLSAYYNANKSAVYSIKADGSLNSTCVQSDTSGLNPHAINTDPSNQYLYVTNKTGNKILQYQFSAATGKYTALNPSEIVPPVGTSPRHFIFHGIKKIMYVSNEDGNSVTVYIINEISGNLTSVQTISTLPTGYSGTSLCADIHITPDNKFLYASNRGYHSIAAFGVNPDDGTLTAINRYFTVTTPREFDIDPTGSYLYAAGETSNNLAYYKINKTTGILDSITTFVVGTTPSWVLIVGFENTVTKSEVIKANDCRLSNYPNPFNASTSIRYFLPKLSNVNLQIFDSSGKLIATLKKGKSLEGYHSLEWDGKNAYGYNVMNGIYYCKLDTDYGSNLVKMLYVR